MIKGKDTNRVFFSEHLKIKHPENYNALVDILEKHHVSHELLKGTKDIWCRDYMPIQVSKDKFIQFRYEPTYHDTEEERKKRSIPNEVLKADNIDAEKRYDINLDGGNVICWEDRVMMTDKVFDENPEWTDRKKLIQTLEHLFEATVIIIPKINDDMTGHIDGMVRFKDRHTLIGNDRNKEYQYWRKGINKVVDQYNLDYVDVPFIDYKIPKNDWHAIGCYVNYLEVGNLIVLPRFEVDDHTDDEVVSQFKEEFPERKIESVNFYDVGIGGGC